MSRLKDSYAGCMECGGSVKMKKGGWIQKAVSKNPGSFTKQAQAAGMSVAGFRNKVLANKGNYSSTTVKRANLAKTLSKMRKGEDGMEVKNKPTESLPDLSSRSSLIENIASPEMVVRGADAGTRRIQTPEGERYTAPGTALSSEVNKGLAKGGTEKVAAYQRMLKAKGFNIDVDGAWGPKTQKAYEQYMSSQASKGTMGPNRSNLPSNNTYYKKIEKAPVSSKGNGLTPKQSDKDTERTSDGLPSVSLPSSSGIKRKQISSPSKPKLPVSTGTLPSVSLPSSSGIKRRMMMGGSIPGVNGSVVGPAVPMSKTGQSFPRRNAGISKLAKYKKK